MNPGLLDNFDQDQLARAFAEINGVPVKYQVDPQIVAQIRKQRQQQAAAAAAVEAAPKLAGAAKDVGLTAAA